MVKIKIYKTHNKRTRKKKNRKK